MTKSNVRRAIAAVLCLACVALVILGGVNLPKKHRDAGLNILSRLRAESLMNAAGDGIVESYVAIAKKAGAAGCQGRRRRHVRDPRRRRRGGGAGARRV